jgi:uncharacterized protein YjbI with pentapeptide repeats
MSLRISATNFGVDWRNVGFLMNCDMSYCDMSYCDMSYCVMSYCDMSYCDMSCCDMSSCDMSYCDMCYCDMSYCDMSCCDMSCCDMSYCDMSYCDMSYWDMSYCDMSYCDMSYCDMCYCDMSYCDMSYCDMCYSDMSYCDMCYCDMSCCDMSYCDMSYCDMSYCDFRNKFCILVGRDSSVSIGTLYVLDGPGMESRRERDFPHPSRPTLGPNLYPLKWVLGLFPGVKRPGRDFEHPSTSSAEVEERIVHLYSHSGPSCPVLGWTYLYLLYPHHKLVGKEICNSWVLFPLHYYSQPCIISGLTCEIIKLLTWLSSGGLHGQPYSLSIHTFYITSGKILKPIFNQFKNF